MKKYSTLILADKRKIDKSILQNYEVNKHLKNYREVIQQIIQNKFGVIVSKEAIVNIVKRLSAELDKI